MRHNILSKKLFIFDLDGTLVPSKLPLRKDMARVLARLLESKKIAIIGGGSFKQFREQFLGEFSAPKRLLQNLFLFPTNSTVFYRYRDGWKRVYEHRLKNKEIKQIRRAFSAVFREIGYKHPKKIYGPVIENRGTQVSFSALGQKASLDLKKKWNKRQDIRPIIIRRLKRHLPKFEIRSGGLTTIDITRKGIDKAYGVREIKKHLRVPLRQAVFIGDALYPGGNDYAAKKTGVDCIQVSGPEETKKFINFR